MSLSRLSPLRISQSCFVEGDLGALQPSGPCAASSSLWSRSCGGDAHASGKTLCYNLPVMQALLETRKHGHCTSSPPKALVQDQVAELMEWSDELGKPDQDLYLR